MKREGNFLQTMKINYFDRGSCYIQMIFVLLPICTLIEFYENERKFSRKRENELCILIENHVIYK